MKFVFEDFELDTGLAEIRRSGTPVAIEPKVFDLLVFLIENRDRVPSKDDIVAAVWDGRFISDSAIFSSIKSLRQALGDDGDAQRVIRTVRGRGFRFVADVQSISAPAQPAEGNAPEGEQSAARGQAGGRPSLAVLPFDASGLTGPEAVLPEAIPHELIQALSRLRWLRVIARGSAFRFAQPQRDLAQIGSSLAVRYALQGSISRIGGVLVLFAELSDCRSSDVIWADRYEAKADDLNALRARVVAEVVGALEIFIPANEAERAQVHAPDSLDAWAHYHLGLRHMYRFSKDDNAKAAAFFEKAIALEPGFARAHAGLSFARFQDAFVGYVTDTNAAVAAARASAERSVTLDALDPFSNMTMGRAFFLDKDPESGLAWLERAVSLSPNFAQGHYSTAFTHAMIGNAAPALRGVDTAQSLSPIDPFLYAIHGVRAFALMREGESERAVAEAETAARAPGAHFLIQMIAAIAHANAQNTGQAAYWRDLARARRADAGKAAFLSAFPLRDDGFRSQIIEHLETAGF